MEEFAKMIYEQWFHSDEAQDYTWGREYDDAWKKIYEILNSKLANEIERLEELDRSYFGR